MVNSIKHENDSLQAKANSRGIKQRLLGKVVSDKMQETAVIQVEKLKRHPKYKKTYRVSKRYKTHNPENRYHEGDSVLIEATRPLSKGKRWRIIESVGERK